MRGVRNKVGFDRAVQVIKVPRGAMDWMCPTCRQVNMSTTSANGITSCPECKQIVMIKER